MMMWMDRDLEEHSIYDQFSTTPAVEARGHHPNGGVVSASILASATASASGNNGGIYQHQSSTPTTTNSMALESSLGGDGSPPPMTDLDLEGSVHQHATLPAMDHRLPMDNHHLDDEAGQHIYEPQQHLYHHLQHHLPMDPDEHAQMMNSSSLYGDHETAMMMQCSSNGDPDYGLVGHGHHVGGLGGRRHSDLVDGGGVVVGGALGKMTHSKPKDKKNYLQIYARQFGLNDRGCYLALGLAALAFLFFVIIIVFIITWPASRLQHSGPLHFCTTPPCLEAAADLLGKQNSSYKACDDFWNYACGGWLSRNPLPSTRSSWSTLESLQQQLVVEKSRLITMSAHEPSQFNSVEWKVHKFYESCMALSFVESDQDKPLLKVINKLGGWEVLRSFNIYAFDAHRVLKRLHAEYFVNAFFRVYVDSDAYSSNKNVIYIMPDGLGMPHRDYYLNRLPDDSSVKAYQTFLKDSAQLFGAASTEAHKFSVDMFNFEKRLAEITPDFEYLADPIKTLNRMTMKDLHTMSMNIPWLDIAKAAYSEAPLSEDTQVVVISPQYVADIAVILSTTDRGSLNNYLMWQLAKAYMPYLSKPFRESVDQYRKALTGATKPPERWEFCAHTTERFFAHLSSTMVADTRQRSEDGERHRVAKKLFDYLKHNIARSISVSSAYDYPARRAAINKLKNMTVQVGTPDFLRDKKYLKFMYKDLLVLQHDFFQNVLYGVIFLRKRQELALVSPSEETRWLDYLNFDNQVSYVNSANKVVVPEVFLQSPLFHPGFPNSVNLGGVGVHMAKSMLEGVLGRGLLFEADGKLRSHNGSLFGNSELMTQFNDPRPILEHDAKCLVDKYSASGLDTVDQLLKCRMDSVLTVAAVWQAFVTLEDILELERGILLPAMETMDPQAVFFLAYAQTLCSTSTSKASDIQRTAVNRLPNKANLLGTLSQVFKFQQFYHCPYYDEEQSCGRIL